MNNTPKCPYCGDRMELHVLPHTTEQEFFSAWYQCVTCESTSPRIEFIGNMSQTTIEKRLQALSSHRAEPVQHGYWIIPTPPDAYTYCKILCSVCNRVAGKHQTEYCPRCGAKMDLPRPRSNSDDY